MTFVLVGTQIPSILDFFFGEDETFLEQKHLTVFAT